jgi:SAM-dependent methyltransferase
MGANVMSADSTSSVAIRRPYQGVLQILEFNWRSYVAALLCIGAAMLALPHLPPIARVGVLLCAGPALWWLVASIVVSHYVYDRFPLYDLTWLSRMLTRAPRRWINIHCGLDETSDLLAAVFPSAGGEVVDIFDARIMTEPSIRQARRVRRGAIAARHAHFDNLGMDAESFDAAFCIFAAHELRRPAERVKLFREVARVLDLGGEFVVMEHLRNWKNFLAFGPGFLHFFSHSAWRRAAAGAGLAVRSEFSLTPFVHVFILRRTL